MIKFFLTLVALFFLSSCHILFNNEPDIQVLYNGNPVQFSLDLPEQNEINLVIDATDYDGSIQSVELIAGSKIIDLMPFDENDSDDSFYTEYSLIVPEGAVEDLRVIVNDNLDGVSVKVFQVDRMASLPGDPDRPVEVIIPEIKIDGGGLLANPRPEGKVYYYNQYHLKSESDIQIDEPIYGEVHANRYLKVTGTAVPDDSGYSDRGYHSVLFSVENDRTGHKFYFSFPVNSNNAFRGYLYFPEPGNYTVLAYRAWDAYLYPKSRQSRGAAIGVEEGYATCQFEVVVDEGKEVPGAVSHLIPTRNVDSGTKYLREYAENITATDLTDMEKVKSVYEFLVFGDSGRAFEYRYYDEIYPGYLDNCWSDIFIASHFLNNREGVCNDYSELFAAMTRALGFKVKKIWGYYPGGSGHQWNLIEIDGTWYRADPTWASGSTYYKEYAEFYSEFKSDSFTSSHENHYSSGLTIEY